MKRKKQAKHFKTWPELEAFLDDMVLQLESIRTPTGLYPPKLRRCIKRAMSALWQASQEVSEEGAIQSTTISALACARLRSRGVPELPAYVDAEIKSMKKKRLVP